MFQAFVNASPLDLADEGIDASLDRLLGDVGVDGISLSVASGPVHALRHDRIDPRMLRSRAGTAFSRAEAMYAATRFKPTAVRSWHQHSPLDQVVQGCEARDMHLRAEVSASACVPRNAGFWCKNVFGAESAESVCLSNPDVQANLCAMVADLSKNYPVKGIVIRDFYSGVSEALDPSLCSVAELSHLDRALLTLCFCESCRQSAQLEHVAIDAAADLVSRLLVERLSKLQAPPLGLAALLDTELFSAYLNWQEGCLLELLRRLRESADCPLWVDRMIPPPMRGLMRLFGKLQPDETVWPVGDSEVDQPRVEVRFPLTFWHRGDAASLVSAVTHLLDHGLRVVTFDGYGMLTDDACAAIRQAVRFARRNSA